MGTLWVALQDGNVRLLPQFVVGGLFLWSGAMKQLRREEFKRLLREEIGFERRTAHRIGSTLPPVEILLGGMLVAGFAPAALGFLAAALLMVFSGVLLHASANGRSSLECGCFGSAGRQSTAFLIARNMGCMVLSVWTAVSASAGQARGTVPEQILVALSAAAILFLLALAGKIHDLARMRQMYRVPPAAEMRPASRAGA